MNKYIKITKLYQALIRFTKSKFKKLDDDDIIEIIAKYNLDTKNKLIEFISKTLTEIGWKTYPHRLLLIVDDFASHPLLKHKEFPLSALLKKFRHFNITVIICVQTTMSIPPDIKRIMSDCILFPVISLNNFKDLIKDSTLSCYDPDELWNEYQKIKNQQTMFICHTKTRQTKII